MLEANPDGTCDFVEEIAAPLPLRIICEMMGIPAADTEQIFHWTNTILGAGDPEYGGSFDAPDAGRARRCSPTPRRSARTVGPTRATTSRRR